LLTRSGITYPEVSSKVYHDSFCQLGSSVSLPWVIYFEAFYLHVVSSFSCIPVICPKLVLLLTPLQFVHLFCNLSKCILLFFSCLSLSSLTERSQYCIKSKAIAIIFIILFVLVSLREHFCAVVCQFLLTERHRSFA